MITLLRLTFASVKQIPPPLPTPLSHGRFVEFEDISVLLIVNVLPVLLAIFVDKMPGQYTAELSDIILLSIVTVEFPNTATPPPLLS